MQVKYTVRQPVPDVAALAAAIMRKCVEAGARGLSNCLVRHFRDLNRKPNAKGFQRSNFWEDAAESVTSAAEGADMVATVAKEGVRLRWLGGTVRPRAGRKALAIPADPSVAGIWPSEYGDGLRLIWPKGRKSGVLAGKAPGGHLRILYRLVGKTVHSPDPSALPSDDEIIVAVVRAMRSIGGAA